MDKYLIGIVHIDIASLVFPEGIGRQIDDSSAQTLLEVFRSRKETYGDTYGDERDEVENQIPASISDTELNSILQESQLTRVHLQSSLSNGTYPKLNTSNRKIYCFHGKHRLRTAEWFFEPDDQWWTVRLHIFPPDGKYLIYLNSGILLITNKSSLLLGSKSK